MRLAVRPVLAGLGLLMLIGSAGCGGEGTNDPGAGRTAPGSSASPEAEGTASPSGPAPQELVDSLLLTEDVVELAEDPEYTDGSGLETATFDYCADEAAPRPGDDLRVARAQRWWQNEAWAAGSPGGMAIGHEIVLYDGDGRQRFLDAFAAVPQSCPETSLPSGETATWRIADEMQALVPDGAVALAHEWTDAGGDATTTDYVVATPMPYDERLLSVVIARGDDPMELGGPAAYLSTVATFDEPPQG